MRKHVESSWLRVESPGNLPVLAAAQPSTRTSRLRRRLHRPARGTVILIVLVTLLFASIAMTAFIEKASTDLLIESRETVAEQLRPEAYSALETTLAVLEDFRLTLSGLRSPAEGWGEPLEFANYKPGEGRTVEVSFEDESAKISLPEAPATTFVTLFKSWNIAQHDAEKLTDALLGWMKKEHIAASASSPRAEDYERKELPFVPPHRSLHSFDELASIDVARDVFYDEHGQKNELWYRFATAFSLFRYQEANINGGNPELLSSLGVTDTYAQQRVADYLKGQGNYRNRGPQFFKSARDLQAVLGPQTPIANVGTEIRALRVRITVREGRQSFTVSAVVASPQGGAELPEPTTVGNTDTEASKAQPSPSPEGGETPQERGQNRRRNEGGTPGPAAGAGAASTQKSLNYPFTLLEIRENDEISSQRPPAKS